jgi:clan AA aspartic protease (TIGR02281 family)
MGKLIALLLVAMALVACGAPQPQTASRAPEGTAPGCYVAQDGQVVCPQQRASYAPPPPQQRVAYAQMFQSRTGTYYVDVGIDGVCCFKMMIDTGASDVSVPLWYAMMKGGHITEDDNFAVARYATANGVVEGLRFRMPPLTISGVTVNNVIGVVTKGDNGKTILLGQSFFRKFKAWQINNATGQLVLAY